MRLEILTRCTRFDNIERIRQNIFDVPSKWDIQWRIMVDTSVIAKIDTQFLENLTDKRISLTYYRGTPGDMGHSMINNVLDLIDGDAWIYVLDDDNILHENFLERTYELCQKSIKYYHTSDVDSTYTYRGIIFSQKVDGKDFSKLDVRVAAKENVCVTKIDMAQFLLHRSIIGDKRLVKNTYQADGIFIEELFKEKEDQFLIHDEILCYYNFIQKPKNKSFFLPRILITGQQIDSIHSIKRASYESDELYLINPEKKDIVKSIYETDPDCIISIGSDYKEFNELCNLSYDFRKRWIHAEQLENIGEIGYNCAMNTILNNDIKGLVSVFTPTYNIGEKIRRTYESLKNQFYRNWEWVIVNDSTDNVTYKILDSLAKEDPRIKVYEFNKKTNGIIGESKYRACMMCNGEYLLELDHDDYLTPDAIQLMVNAFEKYPDAGFCYSDAVDIDENYTTLKYGEGFALGYGKYRSENHFNRNFEFAVAPNINPLTIRHIVGVPNHFRSWRKKAYFEAGCHNRRLSIADDYELIVRTFLTTKIVKVQRGCYLQFFHNSNSQDPARADIQRRVRSIANHYNKQIKERFESLGKVDWAYSEERASVTSPGKFGEEEGFVNYIYEV